MSPELTSLDAEVVKLPILYDLSGKYSEVVMHFPSDVLAGKIICINFANDTDIIQAERISPEKVNGYWLEYARA